jgi:hypothetical protein
LLDLLGGEVMNSVNGYILVPIAIREEDMVRIHFPADITPAEAERVARVIRAYASDPEVR